MRAIFISYRRDDTEGYAGRLFQDLCERFGKDSVFMDVAGIEPGRDFRRVIEQQVASCGVLLAVIGKAWLTLADAQGRRRLDDPYDFVRLETASALKRDIPVIPVLVQQAEMPRAEQMPDDLKDLAFRNSVELTHARWDSDVELLIAALGRYVDAPATERGTDARTAAGAAPGDRVGNTATSRAEADAGGRRQAWVIAPLATLALGGVAYVAWDQLGRGDEPTKDASSAAGSAGAASAATATEPRIAASPAVLPAAPIATSPTAPIAAPSTPPSAAPPAPPIERPAPSPLASASAPMSATTASAPRPVERAPAARAPKPAPAPARSAAAAPAPAPAPAAAPSPDSGPAPATTVARAPAAPPRPDAAPLPAPPASPAPEAARQDPSTELFGGPGSPSTVTRTIVIRPDTKYVNVTGGEVIRFEVDGKSFIWNFNGPRSSFDLSRVAPPSVLDRKVTAYVAPNPIYRRR